MSLANGDKPRSRPLEGSLPNRAMGVFEIVDATVREIRKHLWAMTMPVVVVILPTLLLQNALGNEPFYQFAFQNIDESTGFPSSSVIGMWIVHVGVIRPVLSIWLIAIAHSYVSGHTTFQSPTRRQLLVSYIAWMLSQGLIPLFGVLVLFFFSFLEGGLDAAIIGGLVLTLIIAAIAYPISLVWQLVTTLAPIIAFAESLGPMQAISRAVRMLTKAGFVIIGVSLALLFTTWVTNQALAAVPSALLSIPHSYLWVTQSLAVVIAALVTEPITAMGTVLLYRDVMIRAEGADLQRRINALQEEPHMGEVSTPGVEWVQDDSRQ
ncbi:hypothetical protein [Stomatohabitans albus]|uniref:hypothetical protein n=1 Tax=Stomatohabitans albus TaxID=3110766 RepID=UPI00300C29FD